ncbi:MAG: hypothetical protein BroJett039_01390 [Chloroflexota bacterium]|nr:MAG: hypothetical protein BroJett039_01390 [Chloroflexota bacterium]
MELKQLLLINLADAHDAFTKTVADVTPQIAHWQPPGIMHPIGERYAHLALAEDFLVNGIARGDEPLFQSTWAGRTGFDADLKLLVALTPEMARAFRVDDVNALHAYKDAVFAQTQAFLNDADAARLDSAVDMSVIGLGKIPFPVWFSRFVIGHAHDVMGEISALKGAQNIKGYPF